jgi:hypothetical protein
MTPYSTILLEAGVAIALNVQGRTLPRNRGHSRNHDRSGADDAEAWIGAIDSARRFRRRGACTMTVLANSLKRIWSAKDRFPHRTWWGRRGFPKGGTQPTASGTAYEILISPKDLGSSNRSHRAPALLEYIPLALSATCVNSPNLPS